MSSAVQGSQMVGRVDGRGLVTCPNASCGILHVAFHFHKKYTGVAVDLGCWITRPPCFVATNANKAECSGTALLDFKDNKK